MAVEIALALEQAKEKTKEGIEDAAKQVPANEVDELVDRVRAHEVVSASHRPNDPFRGDTSPSSSSVSSRSSCSGSQRYDQHETRFRRRDVDKEKEDEDRHVADLQKEIYDRDLEKEFRRVLGLQNQLKMRNPALVNNTLISL